MGKKPRPVRPVYVGCSGVFKAQENGLVNLDKGAIWIKPQHGYPIAWVVDLDKAVRLIEDHLQTKFPQAKKPNDG